MPKHVTYLQAPAVLHGALQLRHHVAISGTDVDQPRNLAKSVTVDSGSLPTPISPSASDSRRRTHRPAGDPRSVAGGIDVPAIARVPYGTKSPDSVLNYRCRPPTCSSGGIAAGRRRNTASALSLDLRGHPHHARHPVEPARRPWLPARTAAPGARHRATVARRAYTGAMRSLRPEAKSRSSPVRSS